LVYVAKQASVDQSTLITGKGKSVEFIRQVKKLGQVPVISDQASRSRVYHTHTHRERERERERGYTPFSQPGTNSGTTRERGCRSGLVG
jgi:hypothetical protein